MQKPGSLRDMFFGWNTTKGEDGFSLIEIVVGISILTVGLLGIASMQVSSIHGNARAMEVTEAATWAEDQIEKLMALPYDDDDLAAGDHPDVTQGDYTVSYTVLDDNPLVDTKTVRVTVSWSDRGAAKSMTLRHVIPRIM
jgi:type IV pilus assembly protein PilV